MASLRTLLRGDDPAALEGLQTAQILPISSAQTVRSDRDTAALPSSPLSTSSSCETHSAGLLAPSVRPLASA